MSERSGEELWAERLEAYRAPLLAFIERKMGIAIRHKLEPHDIYQEVSVETLRVVRDSGLEMPDPFPWLCEQAERRIIDAYRRHFGAKKRDARRERGLQGGTRDEGFLQVLAQTMTTPSQACLRDERKSRLHGAIEALSEVPREAIRLRYVEGLPTKEIAQLLGRTDGAVRVLLTRTLRDLQATLGDDLF